MPRSFLASGSCCDKFFNQSLFAFYFSYLFSKLPLLRSFTMILSGYVSHILHCKSFGLARQISLLHIKFPLCFLLYVLCFSFFWLLPYLYIYIRRFSFSYMCFASLSYSSCLICTYIFGAFLLHICTSLHFLPANSPIRTDKICISLFSSVRLSILSLLILPSVRMKSAYPLFGQNFVRHPLLGKNFVRLSPFLFSLYGYYFFDVN